MGKDKKTLSGFSSTMIKAHNGAIFNCDLVQQTPPDLRQKAMRVISGKYVIRLNGTSYVAMLAPHVESGCWDLRRCTLAARVDSFHECSDGAPSLASPTHSTCALTVSVFGITGSHGKKLRDEILHKIEKWQEPPPAKQIKPIALPDDTVRKRRGGKR